MNQSSFTHALLASMLATQAARGAALEAYLPLDGTLAAGTGTSIAGTAIGTNATPADNFTAGKFGQAAFFANTNTSATIPSDWAVSLGNLDALYAASFSVSIWVQTTTTGYTADKAYFGNKNWSSGGNVGWTLSTIGTGGSGGRVNWNSTGGTRKDPNIAFNTGAWRQVVVVFDRENNEVERFLDGVSLGKTAAAFSESGAGNLGAGFPTLIGASGNGTYGGNSVRLDDVAIFSGKLTSTQIAYLYNGGTGRTANLFNEAPVPKDIAWRGAASSEWSTNTITAPKNWVLTTDGSTPADFGVVDSVHFTDSATGSTTVAINGNNVSPSALTFDHTEKDYTLTGSHGIAGQVGLTKAGSGTLTLSNPNSYSGVTAVSDGSLVIDHQLALQGSTLTANFGAGTHTFGAVTAATLGGLAGDADLALTNPSLQPVALTLGANNLGASYGGEITGTGSITKTGTGIQSIYYTNSYSGGTTVAAGTLSMGSTTALGGGTVTSTGGIIEFDITGGAESTVPNNFVLPSGNGALRMFASLGAGRAAPTPGTAVRLTGKISGGSATRQFYFSDTNLGGEHDNATIFDNPANDFLGTIFINRATTAFTSDAALGDPGNDIVHFSENLNGKLRFDAENIVINDQRALDLPSTANNRPIDTQGFTGTIAGPISGTGILVKQGTGKLILSSAISTLTGAVTVSAGTLQVEGVIPSSTNAVTVATGATLGGSGMVQRNVTVSGGTLSPGFSVGTLHGLAALTLAASSSFTFELADWTGAAGTGYDTISANSVVITATSELPGTVIVTPQTLANFSDTQKTFTLVSTTGGVTGFTPGCFTVDASALPAAMAFAWSVQVQGNNLVLAYGEAVGTPFESWALSKGLAGINAEFDADPDRDGIPNGVEFVLGGEPNPANPGFNSVALLPMMTTDSGTGELVFVFRRADAAAGLNPVAEYDTDLAGIWTPAQGGVNGVTINETENGFATDIDRVEVRIPSSQAAAGRLFARLAVSE